MQEYTEWWSLETLQEIECCCCLFFHAVGLKESVRVVVVGFNVVVVLSFGVLFGVFEIESVGRGV